jgi:hypothetical protein
MGTMIKRNSTTVNKCPRDEDHPYNMLSAKLFGLNGYQLPIMAQILSNKEGWIVVKSDIRKKLGFPRDKFDDAWKSLKDLGYINIKRIQGGYKYTIYEDPSTSGFTNETLKDFTSTEGTTCADSTLTNTNNNYNRDLTSTTGGSCDERFFNELIKMYPSEGTRPNGTTYKTTSNLKDCRRVYLEYLRTNGMNHKEIMTALQVEIRDKQMKGQTHYQPGLLKWLEGRNFEHYKGRALELIDTGYGTELL